MNAVEISASVLGFDDEGIIYKFVSDTRTSIEMNLTFSFAFDFTVFGSTSLLLSEDTGMVNHLIVLSEKHHTFGSRFFLLLPLWLRVGY